MKATHFVLAAWLLVSPTLALTTVSVRAAESLRNDRYTLEIATDGGVTINVAGMPPQRLRPEFTVLWTEADPLCVRNPSHPNYPVAPRNAVRWHHPAESLEALNAWVGSPEFRNVTGMAGASRRMARIASGSSAMARTT